MRRPRRAPFGRYDPASAPFDDRNLALPIGFNFPSSCKVAELFEAKFLEKSAIEWEAELEAAGLPCAVIQTWRAWMNDPDARFETPVPSHSLANPKLHPCRHRPRHIAQELGGEMLFGTRLGFSHP